VNFKVRCNVACRRSLSRAIDEAHKTPSTEGSCNEDIGSVRKLRRAHGRQRRRRAMHRRVAILGWAGLGGLCGALLLHGLGAAQAPQTPPPSGKTYFPVVEQDFAKVRADDQAAKPTVMQRQEALLAERYDLSNR